MPALVSASRDASEVTGFGYVSLGLFAGPLGSLVNNGTCDTVP